MSKKLVLSSLVMTAIAVVALFGVLNFSKAYAQSPTATPAAPSDDQKSPKPPDFDGRRGGKMGYSQQNLATALGIDLAEIQAAYESANTEALKQAVEKGLITQAQADAITARGLSNGPIGGLKFFGVNAQDSSIDYNALFAKALGITTDQLAAAHQIAFTTAVDNAVIAGTLTEEQADLIKGREALAADSAFQTAMQSAFEAAVKQAVTNGVITQAQADAILQAQQDQPGPGFFGPGGDFGGRHDFGHDGFRGVPPDNNGSDNTTAPTPTNPDL